MLFTEDRMVRNIEQASFRCSFCWYVLTSGTCNRTFVVFLNITTHNLINIKSFSPKQPGQNIMNQKQQQQLLTAYGPSTTLTTSFTWIEFCWESVVVTLWFNFFALTNEIIPWFEKEKTSRWFYVSSLCEYREEFEITNGECSESAVNAKPTWILWGFTRTTFPCWLSTWNASIVSDTAITTSFVTWH